MVIIRDHGGEDRVRQTAGQLLRLVAPERLVINGLPHVARDFGLGLHLRDGQPAPDPTQWRPPILGRSVHDTTRATDDATGTALSSDYLLAGNVFATRTHPERTERGVTWLASVVASTMEPVIGIGGITRASVARVMATGCAGIAVIDAILADPDPGAAAGRLRTALDACVNDRSTP